MSVAAQTRAPSPPPHRAPVASCAHNRQMGAILIMEAVKARQENETPTPASKKKNKGAA